MVSLTGPIHGREALGWFVDMSAIGASIGYFFICAATIMIMKRDNDNNNALGVITTIGAVFTIKFMIWQLIPIQDLKACTLEKNHI